MIRTTRGALLLCAVPLVLLAGCRSTPVFGSASDDALPQPIVRRMDRGAQVPVPVVSAAAPPPGRLVRDPTPTWSTPHLAAEPIVQATPQPLVTPARYATVRTRPAARSTSLGRGRSVPSNRGRGLFGSPVRLDLSYVEPETINAGIFYAINDRWTVGVIGQRLVQRRTTTVNGQLIDPTDLSSFVQGFTTEEKIDSIVFGPSVQFQAVKETDSIPAIYVGAYALEWGTVSSANTTFSMPSVIHPTQTTIDKSDSPDTFRSIYVSIYKSLPWFRDSGFIRRWSVYGSAGYGARTGRRFTAAETGSGDPRVRLRQEDSTRHSFVGWLGTEVTVPLDISAYAELVTGDECDLGYVVGLRWRSPIGITLGVAFGDCLQSISRRALDLVFLPGGVGGQPSIVQGGGGGSRSQPNHPPQAEEEDEV